MCWKHRTTEDSPVLPWTLRYRRSSDIGYTRIRVHRLNRVLSLQGCVLCVVCVVTVPVVAASTLRRLTSSTRCNTTTRSTSCSAVATSSPADRPPSLHWSVFSAVTIHYGVAERHLNIPSPMSDSEQVIHYVDLISRPPFYFRMLKQINQCLYLLSQPKSQGMKVQALHELFIGLVMSKSHMHRQPVQATLQPTTGTG